MTYEQTLDYLGSLNRFGINLGLVRIKKLLELMDNPQRRYKTIHVTGTNGKGSTTAILASILQQAGMKTGMYTSPHLVDYTERMVIDGQPVSREMFAASVEAVKPFVTAMTDSGFEHPTEFEVLTAAAFYCFADAGVEYAVIEVGLGGKLDSTNVITPEISVITNVTLEHTDRCGSTVEEIAGHKAGIIKPAVPLVTGAEGAALAVILDEAGRKNSAVKVLNREFAVSAIALEAGRQRFSLTESGRPAEEFVLSLAGRHQIANAALAIEAIRELAVRESRLTEAAIRRGVLAASWPGRFEIFGGQPTVIADGAHNPAGAKVLRQALDEYFPGAGITFILGILKDKDIRGVVEQLVRKQDYVITVAPDSERAAAAEELAALLPEAGAEPASSLEAAFVRALMLAGPDGIVCITGSLYLIGRARTRIMEWQAGQVR